MVKFYTDISQITPENRRRVFPLLFDWFYLDHAKLEEHFTLVNSIEAADICILPVDFGFYLSNKRKHEVDLFIASAKKHNKTVWIYSGSDFGITLSEDVITFRLGGFHSKMNPNNFVMPSFINDHYATILSRKWQPILKKGKPTIGFVGHADGSFLKWVKEAIIYSKQTINRFLKRDFSDDQSFFPSSRIRFQLLEKLRTSEVIDSDFIYRSKYRAGAINEVQIAKTTLEFYENMEQNLFTFCLRGAGNFSVRFYETLMMGRIPVLIDTDVRLPFHDELNWNENVVLCTMNNCIQKIVEFYDSHSEEELIIIQKRNRTLALNTLSRTGYFIKISQGK
jgi:hypothetical protein